MRNKQWAILLILATACANNTDDTSHETDKTPPEVTAPRPSGTLAAGTTSTTLAVTTNEAATCKWDLSSTADFASMANVLAADANGTEHGAMVSGLVDGASYVYYVRCGDTAGNANPSSTIISFNVASASDQTPPVISDGQPEGALPIGTTSATMSVKTDENATCKWDSDEAASYAAMANTFATTGGTSHRMPLSGLTDGKSYTYAVRCQDSSGNANTESAIISFSVASASDTKPPVISAGQPSGTLPAGTTSTAMSVKTDENATCRYSLKDTNYSNMTNTFSVTGNIAHSRQISGLQDGQAYMYYVRCIDKQGNANTESKTISWNIAQTTTGSATLAWGASIADATHSVAEGYKIYHCVTPSKPCTKFTELATVAASKLTYTAAGLKSGTHCFGVRAYNSAGLSGLADCSPNQNACCKSIP